MAIRALVERWAALSAGDPVHMVGEVYADDAVVEPLSGQGPTARGLDQVVARESERVAPITERRVTIARALVAPRAAVVEAVLSGVSPGDRARMAVATVHWWWLDDHGRVAREARHVDWSARRPGDGDSRGWMPPYEGRARGDGAWWKARADALGGLWSTDPHRMVDELYTPDCVVEDRLRGRSLRGRTELHDGEAALLALLPVPHRRLAVHDVVAEGNAAAFRIDISGRERGAGPRKVAPGVIVVTLGPDDQVASDRTYWDWAWAHPADA